MLESFSSYVVLHLNQVESAELQLRQNLKALKSKTEEVVSLEQDLNERQKLLEAANSRLEELEESHQTVDAQVCLNFSSLISPSVSLILFFVSFPRSAH